MPKAQLALEYIVKLLIVLVVVAVVISLIIKFKDDIQKYIKCHLGGCEAEIDFPKVIDDKSTFNPGEISSYIEDCYSTMISLPEDKQEDIVCYILIPTEGFQIKKEDLVNALSRDIKDKVDIQTEFKKDVLKIKYQDIGNTILVSD